MRLRTTITVETTMLVVVRAGTARRAWCEQCGADAEMVALRDFGGVPAAGRPALERWLGGAQVHRIDRPDGDSWFCVLSLQDGVRPPQPGSASPTLPSRGSHLRGATPDNEERS
jgi:hypothetical protein